MNEKSVQEMYPRLANIVKISGPLVTVVDEHALRNEVDELVHTAVFGNGLERDMARWLLWAAGQDLGIFPASIHELYMAVGSGDVPHTFTVPAINVRGMNYATSRAVFRAANRLNVGALIFEIARSEIGYTDQRPAEYVAAVIGAAIKEGFRGPLFIQGDHFQVSAKAYQSDAEKELNAVKALMEEAIEAGFYNIDIDTSTLVDLSQSTLDEQQRLNYELCAALTHHARQLEPDGITVSLGGEIGEVGHKNSTVEELHAFMQGYLRQLDGVAGISKISVQTGTSHGGVVLPDGTLAQVSVDFGTLEELSRVAREEYGIGGAVQHGASTLPPDFFNKFPEIGTLEIHLATGFQNIIFDNAPQDIVDRAYRYVHENLRNEWKEGKTEEQFLYSSRKKAFGALKQEWWKLEPAAQTQIGQVLEEQFEFLFSKLNVAGTREIVQRVTTRVSAARPQPTGSIAEAELEIAADLAD